MRLSSVSRMPALASFVLLCATPGFAEEKYSLKTASTAPPNELKEPIRSLLGDQALQVADGKGQPLCEIWFRKSVPAKATEEQVKNGLTYRELDQTTVLGAVRFAQQTTDYRKQTVKPGVYTLRLAYQPQDGDHMGTAPHQEFCLLVAAAEDAKPDTMEPKALHEASAKTMGGNHPGVLLLFPNDKPDGAAKLEAQENEHWVIKTALPVDVGGKSAKIGIGLTVVGHSSGA